MIPSAMLPASSSTPPNRAPAVLNLDEAQAIIAEIKRLPAQP